MGKYSFSFSEYRTMKYGLSSVAQIFLTQKQKVYKNVSRKYLLSEKKSMLVLQFHIMFTLVIHWF